MYATGPACAESEPECGWACVRSKTESPSPVSDSVCTAAGFGARTAAPAAVHTVRADVHQVSWSAPQGRCEPSRIWRTLQGLRAQSWRAPGPTSAGVRSRAGVSRRVRECRVTAGECLGLPEPSQIPRCAAEPACTESEPACTESEPACAESEPVCATRSVCAA
jgi:hypothetical protein